MNKIFSRFCFLFAYLFFASCSEDENPSGPCLLSEYKASPNGVHLTYQYDRQNKLIQHTDGDGAFTYEYSENEVTITSPFISGNVYVYTYTGTRLDKIVTTTTNPVSIFIQEFTYSDTEVTVVNKNETTEFYRATWTWDANKENFTKIVEQTGIEEPIETTLTYSAALNPFNDPLMRPGAGNMGTFLAKNQIIFPNQTLEENKNNLPAEIQEGSTTYLFTYTCKN